MSEIKTLNTSAFRQQQESEPEWLYDLQRSAWDSYSEMPLPDRVVHLWKYTEPEKFVPMGSEQLLSLLPLKANGHGKNAYPVPAGESAIAYNDSSLLTLANLSEEAKSKGVVLVDLATAAQEHSDLVKEYLGSAVGEDFDKFEALNLAVWNTGLFLYVPKGVTLDNPVHLHRTPGNSETFLRLLVVAGENSEFTVVDDYQSRQSSARLNSVVELIANDSARVKFATVIRLEEQEQLFLTQRNRIGRNVQLKSSAVSIGGGVVKVNWGTLLEGQGADSRWTGVLLGGDEQHFDNHTIHRHVAGETYSNLEFKVALQGRAVSAYTGRIRIEEHAANCQAYQENRNLLLSDTAKVESIPELEIINDEVKCSHGVTVGMIEPEQIFYLSSRGIDPQEAVQIILEGFFEEPLAEVPALVKNISRDLLLQKLGR